MTDEERIKKLEDHLLKVVRALIVYTQREKNESSGRLRMDLQSSGVLPNLATKREKP